MKFLKAIQQIWCVIAILVMALGCQRVEVDSLVEQISTDLTVIDAQKWFDANYSASSTNTRQSGNNKLRKQLRKETDWSQAYTMTTAVGEGVIVPLKWETNLISRYRADGVSVKPSQKDCQLGQKYLTYGLMYRDKKGKPTIELITAMPDGQWGEKPTPLFSGVILVEDWNGELLRGYKYKNGQIVAEASTEEQTNKKGRLCVVGIVEHYSNVNGGTRNSDGSVNYTGDWTLSLYATETIYADDCGGGGGGGNYIPPTYTNTPTGIDIYKPISSISRIVVTSSAKDFIKFIKNNVTDPCRRDMVNEVVNRECGDVVADLIRHFTTTTGQILEITVVEGSLANTTDVAKFKQEWGAGGTLTLDGRKLDGASQEYIQSIIMHEFVHAYLSLVGGFDGYQLKGFSQHAIMTNFVDKMAAALMSRFPSSLGSNPEEAKALAWGGLAETDAWKQLPDNYKKYVNDTLYFYSKRIKGSSCPQP